MLQKEGLSARSGRALTWLPITLLVCISLVLAACGGSPTNTPTSPASGRSTVGTQPTQVSASATGPATDQAGETPATESQTSADPTISPTAGPSGQAQPTAAATQASPTKVDRSKPAAVVNGEPISFEQLDSMLERRYGSQILNQLVVEKLLLQEARKRNLTVSESEIDAELKQAQESFPGQDIEKLIQEQSGYTLAEFREQLRLRLLVEKLLEPQLKVTDRDLKAYYEANQQQLATPEQIDVLRVVTDDQAKAAAAAKDLRAGKKIQEVIAQHGSKQQGRAAQSGDLGFIGIEQLGPELGPIASGMNDGDVSQPVQLQGGGFAVLKVEGRRGGDVPPLDKVRDKVTEAVKEQKLNEQVPAYIEQLRSKAKIDSQIDLSAPQPGSGSGAPAEGGETAP